MSSLTRRMQRNSGQVGTDKVGRLVGIPRNSKCKCCLAKAKRDAKKGGEQ